MRLDLVAALATLASSFVAVGCGGDSTGGGSGGGRAGTGGAAGASGGATGGGGTSASGSGGGAVAGSGGTASGSGGVAGGGAVSGSGGATAGSGGAHLGSRRRRGGGRRQPRYRRQPGCRGRRGERRQARPAVAGAPAPPEPGGSGVQRDAVVDPRRGHLQLPAHSRLGPDANISASQRGNDGGQRESRARRFHADRLRDDGTDGRLRRRSPRAAACQCRSSSRPTGCLIRAPPPRRPPTTAASP